MIKFLSKQAFLEESSEKRKIFLIVEEEIREYEKRMLCDSGCPFTLPMYFIFDEGTSKVYYDFTGFIQLEEYIKRKTTTNISGCESQKKVFDVLDILSKILECLKGMESYLLFPERITIHPDLIFINLYDGRFAFAFYPNEKLDIPLQSTIYEMVDTINEFYDDVESKQFLAKFKDYIYMKNPGLDGMISNLGILQREASYIFWNMENFRREEEIESFDCRESVNKPFSAVLRKQPPLKIIIIQALLGVALLAVFQSGLLELISFTGLVVIAAALDLLFMRTLRLKIRGEGE